MRFGSVCSGIEAATVAWHPLGWRAAFYSEIDAFPSAVLAHHYPETPNLGDMTKFREWPDADIDLLVGGTPCQSFSVAGLRKGLDDPRGNLALTYLAIAERYRPRWLVWENVPGVLSSNGGRDFGTFLGGLAELGYGFAYRVLDAQYFGVAQRRRRVFVVASSRGWASAAAVLFERASLRGDPAPSRETGEVAPTIPSHSTGGGGLGTDFDCDGGLIRDWPAQVASTLPAAAQCLTTGTGQRFDPETETLIPTFGGGTQTSLGYDPKAGVTGSLHVGQTPAVALALRGREGGATAEVGDDCAFSLRASTGGGDKPHVLVNQSQIGVKQHANAEKTRPIEALRILREAIGEEAFCVWSLGILAALQPAQVLQSSLHGTGFRCATFSRSWVVYCALSRQEDSSAWLLQSLRETECDGCPPQGWEPSEQLTRELGAYLSELSQPGAQATRFVRDLREASEGSWLLRQALSAVQEVGRSSGSETQSAHRTYAVRRLTVEECEFLQGFPRGYTRIPWRGKPAELCPDGPRYKALGNSMAVPVMRWIGERIALVDELIRENEGPDNLSALRRNDRPPARAIA